MRKFDDLMAANVGLCWFAGTIAARSFYLNYYKLATTRPEVVYSKKAAKSTVVKALTGVSSIHSGPSPNWLTALDVHGQLQTIYASLLRYWIPRWDLQTEREVLTLSDGGTVGLDWLSLSSGAGKGSSPVKMDGPDVDPRPIVIMAHGLCGSSQSEYITHTAHSLLQRGFRVVVFVARGCGGLQLHNPVSFSAAKTSDIETAVNEVHRRYPKAKLFGIGFSLGASILLNYLGKHSHEAGAAGYVGGGVPLTAAVSVCPPWDLNNNTTGVHSLWSFLLAGALKGYFWEHKEIFEKLPGLDFTAAMQAPTYRDFDVAVALAIHGFPDISTYYHHGSPAYTAKFISTPTLAITAVDDPCVHHGGAPDVNGMVGRYHAAVMSSDGDVAAAAAAIAAAAEAGEGGGHGGVPCVADAHAHLGSGLVLVKTITGGHLAYIERPVLNPSSSWVNRVADEWFSRFLEEE